VTAAILIQHRTDLLYDVHSSDDLLTFVHSKTRKLNVDAVIAKSYNTFARVYNKVKDYTATNTGFANEEDKFVIEFATSTNLI
jgi:hypothetical protein